MKTILCLALVGLIMACNNQGQEADPESSGQALVTDDVPVVRITRPSRTEGQVTAKLSRLVDVFGDSASAPALRLHHTAVALPTRAPQ